MSTLVGKLGMCGRCKKKRRIYCCCLCKNCHYFERDNEPTAEEVEACVAYQYANLPRWWWKEDAAFLAGKAE